MYVVTNNHFRGKAVANALMLESMVEGAQAAAPPPLFDEYGEVLAGYAEPRDPPPPPKEAEEEAPKPKAKTKSRTKKKAA